MPYIQIIQSTAHFEETNEALNLRTNTAGQ